MADSAATAAFLWDEWLAPSVRRLIASGFGDDQARARSAAVFLAASHDVGKASVAFAAQVPTLSSQMVQHTLTFPLVVSPDDRRLLPHSLASHVALFDWLSDHGWTADSARRFAVVVGGHHGVPPTAAAVRAARDRPDLLGVGAWESVRTELLDEARRISGFDPHQVVGGLAINQQTQVLVTGLVIMADWIASNTDLFPLFPLGLDHNPREPLEDRAASALGRLALPRPWAPSEVSTTHDDADELFASRFARRNASARPVQRAAVSAARAMDEPGLLVIEAPTGEGKTEAALLAAEILAARWGAGGVFVALPTQATTDAMFTRVLQWLAHLPDTVVTGDSSAHSVVLSHGKSGLNRAFRDLSWLPAPDDIGSDDEGARCTARVRAFAHGWITGRKKSALADFVVGTVDQLLFTSLKSPHLAMRHLGLAGKVVILDEVHAVDIYMDTYLLRAIEWCGAYSIPVIALSATLPEAQRSRLHAAYGAGRSSARGVVAPEESIFGRRKRRTETTPASAPSATPDTPPYPVITSSTGGGVSSTTVEPSPRSVEVVVETLDDSTASLVGLLDAALTDGGCALVVRNTVSRATATFDALRAAFGDDVTLMHSRFVSAHRTANDEWLRSAFGPPGSSTRRPHRSIVVATQVVEQSLDIDFDLLVTDLAPMDLLVQRMGRLHRHARDDRAHQLRQPRCVVVGVEDWSEDPPRPDRGSQRVYGEHLLLRTAALVRERAARGQTVRSPHDVAHLVQATYGSETIGPHAWQDRMAVAQVASDQRSARSARRASTFLLDPPRADGAAIVGWVDGGAGEADEDGAGRAQVRDSDESCEVVLLRRTGPYLSLVEGVGSGTEGSFVGESYQPRAIAELIAASTVRIPGYYSHDRGWDDLIDELGETYFDAWQRDPLLRGQLVLLLDEDQTATVAGYEFRYSAQRGLEVARASSSPHQSVADERRAS